MKLLSLVMAIVLSMTTFANEQYRISGEVIFGAELMCKVSNPIEEDLTITDYGYRVLWVNQYGYRVWTNVHYTCGFNCDLLADEVQYLTGPYNRRNVIAANCWANAVVLDSDDDQDDDDDVIEELI